MQIAVLETGGTINGILGPEDPPPSESRVLAWLENQQSRLNLELSSEIVCMKDSRALTHADRARLVGVLESQSVDRILIPHGTFTMPDTGVFLRKQLSEAAREKSVVLVGSLVPLGEPDSDAPANLEFALQCLAGATPGTWIAMQDALWNPGEIVKDPISGRYLKRS